MKSRTLTLNPKPPYDFHLTAEFLASYQGGSQTDVFEDGQYQRLFLGQNGPLLATVVSMGQVDSPQLTATVQGSEVSRADAASVKADLEWILTTDAPLGEFYAQAARDPIIGPVVGAFRGMHPTRTPTVFEALAQAVSAQQISSAVARAIRSRLLERYGPSISFNDRTYYAFPNPQAVASAGIQGLRDIGLSNRKAEYILDVATSLMDGSLDLEALRHLPDDQVAEKLLALRGVGRWTVHWLLIRALGRMDALPAGDLALQKVISQLYFQGERLSEEGLEEFSRRWSPWRSLFTMYLFAALRKGLVKM